MNRGLWWLLAISLGAWLILFLSGKGVLISQHKVQPGDRYHVDGWGDVGKAKQASLVCTYFLGTHSRKQVFWYSPNGLFGRADCPTVIDR